MRRALLSFVLLLLLAAGGLAGEQCTAQNGSKCSKSDETAARKYTKEANVGINAVYTQKIDNARVTYEECDTSKCGCHAAVISNDLRPFKSGITKEMLQNIKAKGTKYQIVGGKLYRERDCMFPARCTGIEHFLRVLSPKLPDLEIVVNTRDWPQINKNHGPFGPVFSFSKTPEFSDIMYPAWAFWEGGPAIGLYPRGIGRWDVHREQLSKKANSTPWELKDSKGFFRGSRTSSERDALVLLSRERPELVDAKYTKNQAWKSDADTLQAPPAEEVSFESHCNYKYLFNFRGVAASFRLKHVLLCKSLVFHVGDSWQEFFYPALKPWVHYVPVASDANKAELARLLEFFKNNDDIAQTIANNGFQMIWNNLRMQDVTCYWRKLLKRYSKLLKYKVELDGDLIEIN